MRNELLRTLDLRPGTWHLAPGTVTHTGHFLHVTARPLWRVRKVEEEKRCAAEAVAAASSASLVEMERRQQLLTSRLQIESSLRVKEAEQRAALDETIAHMRVREEKLTAEVREAREALGAIQETTRGLRGECMELEGQLERSIEEASRNGTLMEREASLRRQATRSNELELAAYKQEAEACRAEANKGQDRARRVEAELAALREKVEGMERAGEQRALDDHQDRRRSSEALKGAQEEMER